MFVVNVEGAIRRNEKWLLIRRSEKEEHAGGGLSLVERFLHIRNYLYF